MSVIPILFWIAATIVVGFLCLEVAARFAMRNGPKDRELIQRAPMFRDFRTIFVLHPYFGYTRRQGTTSYDVVGRERGRVQRMLAPNGGDAWLSLPANSEGLFCPELPVERRDDQFVVAVTGGSVATWFGLQAPQALQNDIRLSGVSQGKAVVVLNFGVAGSKQPQQIAILNFVLALGQKIDLVINIDGFNEIVWGSNNYASRLSGAYPSHHILFPLKSMISDIGWNLDLLALMVKHARCVSLANRAALYERTTRLALVRFLLFAWERFLRARAETLILQCERMPHDPSTDPYAYPEPRKGDVPLERCVGIWRQGTESLAATCRGRGIRYLHVLQPHMEAGNKRLTTEERELRAPNHPYMELLRNGYPLLSAAIPPLQALGVRVEDASEIFDGITETVYSDMWSHLNQRGNEILSGFIGRALRNC